MDSRVIERCGYVMPVSVWGQNRLDCPAPAWNGRGCGKMGANFQDVGQLLSGGKSAKIRG
jgi:hypothetical protein